MSEKFLLQLGMIATNNHGIFWSVSGYVRICAQGGYVTSYFLSLIPNASRHYCYQSRRLAEVCIYLLQMFIWILRIETEQWEVKPFPSTTWVENLWKELVKEEMYLLSTLKIIFFRDGLIA